MPNARGDTIRFCARGKNSKEAVMFCPHCHLQGPHMWGQTSNCMFLHIGLELIYTGCIFRTSPLISCHVLPFQRSWGQPSNCPPLYLLIPLLKNVFSPQMSANLLLCSGFKLAAISMSKMELLSFNQVILSY